MFIAVYMVAEVALVPSSLLTMAAGLAHGPITRGGKRVSEWRNTNQRSRAVNAPTFIWRPRRGAGHQQPNIMC